VSVYVTEKVTLLENRVEVAEGQLAAVEARIAEAQEQQDALATNQSLAPVERLLLSQNLNAVITTADARRSALQEDLDEARQLLNLAENVESSRVVERAAASKTTARSSRSSLLVGALIGLLLGAIAALVVDPIVARRRGSSSTSA
jgi:DNA-binding FrmR family transcriptional regulator